MDNQVVSKFCSNCGAALTAGAAFCGNCGTKIEQAAAPVTPVAPVAPVEPVAPVQPIAPVQPAQYTVYQPATQEVQTKSKIFGFIGFGLAIFGMLMSFICFINAVTALDYSYYSMYEELSTTLGLSVIFIPASIIGLIFSKNSRNEGFTSAITKVGQILGLISTILFGLVSFISFIGMVS